VIHAMCHRLSSFDIDPFPFVDWHRNTGMKGMIL
jgi:hypothetical protein